MIDPQDNTKFKKDIAEGFAKMKERRREKVSVWPKSEGEQPLVSMAQIAEEIFKVPKEDNIVSGIAEIAYDQRNYQNVVDVEVKIPLIKNSRPYFNLNVKFIEKAKREGKMMRISWPNGSAIHSPDDWLKTGTPYQKEFNFAGSPMEMVGNFLDHE